MSAREWTVEDLFGRWWRFHIDAYGSTGDASFTREVVDTLSHLSLMRPPQRGDRVAETFFELFAHLERGCLPETKLEWGAAGDEGRAGLEALRQTLLRNADIGRLRVERVQPDSRLHHERESPPSESEPREPEPDDWIGIELVDDDGEPIPGVAYRIEGPTGDVHTGTTDASGKARVEGLEPGDCKVSFPRLHEPAWREVG